MLAEILFVAALVVVGVILYAADAYAEGWKH